MKGFVPRLRVFLAEDDREMRQLIARSLRRDGHFVIEAADGEALVRDLGHAFWGEGLDTTGSLIITDVRMPGPDGLSILRRLGGHRWCPPFIVITAFGDPQLHQQAHEAGAVAVFDKPFDLDRLRAEVEEVARSQPAA